MFIPNKTTALLEPVDVHVGGKIVLEEDDRDQDEASHEGEAGEVVHILCGLSDVRKGIRTDERQEHDLAECDVQASKAQHDEGCRRQPMRKTFKRLEAKDFMSGAPCRNTDSSDDQISQAQEQDCTRDHDCGAPMQQDLV